MSLSDVITADVSGLFLNTNDFAVSLALTLQGGDSRTISVIKEGNIDAIFETGTSSLDYDIDTFLISAVDDTNGRVDPQVSGRGGNAGDSFKVNNTGSTWYFRKILQDGRPASSGGCGSGMHRILCATSQAAWPNG